MKNHKEAVICSFLDENSLFMAYMPFLKGGGLFVRTHANYSLGDQVSLTINLLNEPEALTVAAVVVWITPRGAQSNKPAGIGLQFQTDDSSHHLTNKIETYLAGMLKSTHCTDTM